ncbi:MAG: hypothetical protein ACJ77N_00150 [Chloroflexota bacterium]|jgi:hypothetical protein
MFEGLASAQPLALTLYTDAFVVRGTYSTRHRRVTDILNGADTQFLVLADVTIDEFGSSVQAQRTDYAQVNLASVLFAVADGELEALPELRTPKVAATALISVPPFKITGSIHLLPIADLREALGELTGTFVPATDATFWSDSLGEPHTKASLVAFNHARAQILAPHREVDPWAVPASAEMSTQAADTARSNGW